MEIKYKDILSIDKIIDVYENIRLNTRHKAKIVRFEMAFSCNVIKTLDILKNEIYVHQKYSIFLIQEPKYRIIMSENILDKIINHLVSKYVLIPSLIPKLIDTNVATRSGKGSKAEIFYVKKYINALKQNNDKVYVLKCDISKYFYNISHKILFDKLKKDIKDEKILKTLKEIICSTDKDYINRQIDNLIKREIVRLKGKNISDIDLKIKELSFLPRYKKGTGLPIGNETSQILAIYYLNSLDHFIKEKLKIKYYVRYMDDFVLFSSDKEYLKYCLKEINIKIKDLKLNLNKKTQIYDVDKGFNFLGYKFKLKNKKLIVLINNQTKKRVKRKLRKMKKRNALNYSLVKASYNGYFKVANSKNFIYKAKF